jgi:beta propeller repeat protein
MTGKEENKGFLIFFSIVAICLFLVLAYPIAAESFVNTSGSEQSNLNRIPQDETISQTLNSSSNVLNGTVADASNSTTEILNGTVADASNSTTEILNGTVADASNSTTEILNGTVADASNSTIKSPNETADNEDNLQSSPAHPSFLDQRTVSILSTATWDNDQEVPALWEDRVVWVDWRYGNAEIVMYNITSGEERRLTNTSSDENNPKIFGDLVVWEYGNDIILYNLSSNETRRISDESYNQVDPSIWGNYIVWEDQSGEYQTICCYDINTGEESQVSEDGASASKADVWGNYIVWEQWFEDNSEIMLFNISDASVQRITFDPQNQESPVIWEDRIVWTEFQNGYSQILVYNITTGIETNLTSDPWNHLFLAIFGDLVAYESDQEYSDISIIDINTGEEYILTQGTPDTAQNQPAIWGDRIVWRDARDWFYDIYLCTLGVSKPPLIANFTTDITDGLPPLTIQFSDTSTGDVEGWCWDFGDGTISHEQNPVHTYTNPEIIVGPVPGSVNRVSHKLDLGFRGWKCVI